MPTPRTPRHLVVLVVLALAGTALAAPARAAADQVASTTTLAGEPRREGEATPLRVTLTGADGARLAAREVLLERRAGDGWRAVAALVTDAEGVASTTAPLSRRPADNTFRATFGGDPPAAEGATYAGSTATADVALVRRSSALALSAPRTVVDERQVTLVLTRRTGEGAPVPGWASVQRRRGDRWVDVARVHLGDDGRGTLRQRPRVDAAYRAVAGPQAWVTGAVSPVRRIDNLPPGEPVGLPAGAPRPRITLPPQRRATTAGADARVSRVPAAVWSQMTGRSWHRGCPVGRAGLRLVRVNYWDYDGYRRRGEVVVAAWAARRAAAALSAMYRRGLPIRAMYRVDRFGWSSRLRGADDYRSMAAGNTSGFNCRDVVGRPGVRSPHAWGGAVDLNTWENPYRSSGGWMPTGWWVGRSHPRVAWRSSDHPVVRLWRDHGFRWTYGTADAHHFDAVRSGGRVVRARGCATSCH